MEDDRWAHLDNVILPRHPQLTVEEEYKVEEEHRNLFSVIYEALDRVDRLPRKKLRVNTVRTTGRVFSECKSVGGSTHEQLRANPVRRPRGIVFSECKSIGGSTHEQMFSQLEDGTQAKFEEIKEVRNGCFDMFQHLDLVSGGNSVGTYPIAVNKLKPADDLTPNLSTNAKITDEKQVEEIVSHNVSTEEEEDEVEKELRNKFSGIYEALDRVDSAARKKLRVDVVRTTGREFFDCKFIGGSTHEQLGAHLDRHPCGREFSDCKSIGGSNHEQIYSELEEEDTQATEEEEDKVEDELRNRFSDICEALDRVDNVDRSSRKRLQMDIVRTTARVFSECKSIGGSTHEQLRANLVQRPRGRVFSECNSIGCSSLEQMFSQLEEGTQAS